MQRVFCPFHKEKTPSVVIYESHGYCFGGCGVIPLSELGNVRPAAAAPPTDLKSELERIRLLPKSSVRGLHLPVDGDSYYIVWPEENYYKRRKFFPGEGPKYLCPRGHKKPLFVAHNPKGATQVAVIEGELNSLSLATLNPKFAICSPGGVGNFNEKELNNLHFDRYLLILDKDKAGLEAAIKAREILVKRTPYVEIVLMEKDLNQLLQDGQLQDEAKKRGWLEM